MDLGFVSLQKLRDSQVLIFIFVGVQRLFFIITLWEDYKLVAMVLMSTIQPGKIIIKNYMWMTNYSYAWILDQLWDLQGHFSMKQW